MYIYIKIVPSYHYSGQFVHGFKAFSIFKSFDNYDDWYSIEIFLICPVGGLVLSACASG